MPVALLRVDDRLVHGQVTMGWVQALNPDRIVVVNDRVYESPWETDLYLAAVPPELASAVLPVCAAIQRLEDLALREKVLVLVDSPQDAVRLIEGGLQVSEVNVGGMHYCDGKRQILPYVCVDAADAEALRRLEGMGVRLDCRDLPGSRRTDLNPLLSEIGQ